MIIITLVGGCSSRIYFISWICLCRRQTRRQRQQHQSPPALGHHGSFDSRQVSHAVLFLFQGIKFVVGKQRAARHKPAFRAKSISSESYSSGMPANFLFYHFYVALAFISLWICVFSWEGSIGDPRCVS